MSMEMTGRRSYKELWVVAGVLLLVILIARLPRATGRSEGGAGTNTRMIAVMGETRRMLVAEQFEGVSMTAVMGQCRLDLRNAIVQPGEEVVVDVLTVMGGITIRVPDGWIVDTQALPIMGALKDLRIAPSDPNLFQGQRPPRLVLHGAVVLGGVEITS